MGSFFTFGRAVPEIFEFECLKKGCFFGQDLEGTYASEMAPKGRFLKSFFAILWE